MAQFAFGGSIGYITFMKHTLPGLAYAYDALEPWIDTKTMEIHYTKHHQAYIDKLNTALEKHPDLADKPIETLLKDLNQVPEDIRMAVRNQGGGFYNHNLFWKMMTPGGSEPIGTIGDAITGTFKSFEDFKTEFVQAATGIFGSGWAWLVKDGDQIKIVTTPNQDNPLSEGLVPLLGIDVWEHAYYLKYQNRRPDYLSAWWNVVNWPQVEDNFTL